MNFKSLVVMLVLARVFSVGVTLARTNDMKQLCVNCHTMHNSQGGVAPVVSGVSNVRRGALLNSTCYGCHTTDLISPSNVADGRPFVLDTSSPVYGLTGTEAGHTTLAGGDFSWVANGGDLKGHNVSGIVTTQASRFPPGGSPLNVFDTARPLTCAGINGCHGDLSRTDEIVAMSQTHHAAELTIDGLTVAQSFRFLNGIVGYEDPKYELNVGNTPDLSHNQYKGAARVAESSIDTTTISYSCARCHGDFHSGSGDSGVLADSVTPFVDPWIRHPVDYDMGGLGGEYLGYGPGGTYNFATPLGSITPSAPIGAVTLNVAAGNAIVVCVSCHRAHGSPYDYSLRWDYKNWPTSGYNGCGDCHTAKD